MKQNNERVAALEAKVDILLELLKEIKEDIKNSPTREEYKALDKKVEKLKDSITKLLITTGIVSGVLGFLGDMAWRIWGK
jgi:vacuolar-type H+-ATPase subunit E/Vma4